MTRPYKVHDSVCENDDGFQIMSFVGGSFAGVPFKFNMVNVTEDGKLEYDYNLYIANQPDFDKELFDKEIGNFLLDCLTESIQGDTVDQNIIQSLDEMFPDDVIIIEESE